MKNIKYYNEGVVFPKGFMAGAVSCGIKKGVKSTKKDLGIIYSDRPAKAAAMFTKNEFKAAPVIFSQKNIKNHYIRAIVVNSGNANAGTGKRGLKDTCQTAKTVSEILNIPIKSVLVASTGVIGVEMPMNKIVGGIKSLKNNLSFGDDKSIVRAIMTTDTKMKRRAAEIKIGADVIKIGAIAKGTGMIAPNLATMLVFLTADACINKKNLKRFLTGSIDKSFNAISVDGDCSTNDMVCLLANGASGGKQIIPGTKRGNIFQEALDNICISLAKMLIEDGEGATKLIEINVKRVFNIKEAKIIAGAIANSNLVKTAIHGGDPNWGRIIAAIGSSGISRINPDKIDVYIGNNIVCHNGCAVKFSEPKLKALLRKKQIQITVCLNQGKAETVFWTCDLSKKYVDINAHYRS
jgi:glutamate N-acetyltransferase/amino-acid N-acetyltransferase